MKKCRCGCKEPVTSEANEFLRGHQTTYRVRVFSIADDPTHHKHQQAYAIIDERGWAALYDKHLYAQKKAAEQAAVEPKPCLCKCGELAKSGNEFIRGHQTTYRARVFRIAADATSPKQPKALDAISKRGWTKLFERWSAKQRNIAARVAHKTEKKVTRRRTRLNTLPVGISADEYVYVRDLLESKGITSGKLRAGEIREVLTHGSLDGVSLSALPDALPMPDEIEISKEVTA